VSILWAPWRIKYILEKNEPNCVFCPNNRKGTDKENLILFKGRYSMVMMNRYPYNNGHLLVSPLTHTPDLEGLSIDELTDLIVRVKESIRILRKVMSPDGFNVGLNLDKVAGAGMADHVHFHIVPRWNGDTSYMTVLGKVRVIPEGLESTYQRLKPHFDALKLKEA